MVDSSLNKQTILIMKKILILSTCLIIFLMNINATAQSALTKDERSKALEHLKKSQSELLKTVKGLSERQLNFKLNEETWSIAECMEHIAISEKSIFGIVQMTLQNEPDPTKRSEVKMTDDQVIGLITNRERKVKTRPESEPKSNFGSYEGSLMEYKEKRKSNIGFVKSTKDDLRNRYFEFPFGTLDSYQVILFLSGHSVRHTYQIKEVMTNESFPKS